MRSRLLPPSNKATAAVTLFGSLAPVPSALFRYSIAIFHIHSFSILLFCDFSFFIPPSPCICRFDTTFSSALCWFWPAFSTSIKLEPVDSVPPSLVFLLDYCLSVSPSGEAVSLSVKKCLIFGFLAPVCLSVCAFQGCCQPSVAFCSSVSSPACHSVSD